MRISFHESPEIINRRGHDKDTDYWSLGILAYQMMVGVVPFNGSTVDVGSHLPFHLVDLLSHHATTHRAASHAFAAVAQLHQLAA